MSRCLGLLLFAPIGACVAQPCADAGERLFGNSFESNAAHAQTGVTRFVARDGLDSASGSRLAPWRTLQHGVDQARAGDTVCVRGGRYGEVVTITGGGSQIEGDIVLQAYPGEIVTLDGTGLGVPNGQWGLVTLVDASHVAVHGFEIAHYSTSSADDVPIGIYVTGAGRHLSISANHIHDIRTSAPGCSGNAFGLKVDGTRADASIDALSIRGNELDDLVLGCSESLSLDGNVENWDITGNLVHHSNNIGIAAIGYEGIAPDPALDRARDGVIAGNTVHHITSFGNPAYGNVYAAGGIYIDGGTRIVVERNLVHHVDLGIEVASEHGGRTSSYVTVRNNIVHSGQSAGISIGGYEDAVGGTDHCSIVNNTLFRNDSAGTGSGEFQIQYHASDNLFANNIVHAGPQALLVNAFAGDTAAPAGLDANLYHAPEGDATWVWRGDVHATLAGFRAAHGGDAGSSVADPAFVAPLVPDLRVDPASPAVDAGLLLGPVAGNVDFAGGARVSGARVDIGAYER